MESDGSDKDRYQPEDEEGSEEDEVESEDEAGSEKEVTSKKGNKAKPGRHEIAAIRTTAPTTGSQSAVEHSKRRQRSPRSVPWNLCIYQLH